MTETVGEEFQPFWDAAAAGELRFPFCRSCQRFHWYPMIRCPHCSAADLSWRAIDPSGSLYSWTIVQRPFDAAFNDRTPYIVGLLEFPGAPGVRLITNLIDIDTDLVEFGLAVAPAFDLYDVAESRLMFRPKVKPARSLE